MYAFFTLGFHTDKTILYLFAGFESILEGIYGPRLLQDLNIFDGKFYVVCVVIFTHAWS